MGAPFWIAVTDRSWFEFLRAREPDEVNFWQPSGKQRFRAIGPGGLFLFKLHSPDDYIVGGGFFVRHTQLPIRLAWEAFGEKNGAPSLRSFTDRIDKFRREGRAVDAVIGCNILVEPFFFPNEYWISAPRDWAKNIVRGKTYHSGDEIGAEILRQSKAGSPRYSPVLPSRALREPWTIATARNF